MNIVMIVASLPPLAVGGAEMQALALGQELMEKGIKVSFITPGRADLKRREDFNGVPVYRLFSFLSRLFYFFAILKRRNSHTPIKVEYDDQLELTDEIFEKIKWPTLFYYHFFFLNCLFLLWPRRKSIDIIHAHTMEWSAVVAARLGRFLGKPVIIKDSTMNGFQSIRRFPNGERLQKMIIRKSSFIAMTKVIEDNLRKAGIPEDKIFRIPNGINLRLNSGQLDRQAAISYQVLFVGNLYQQPAKGIDILLKAWCLVYNKFPDARLKVIGDGNTSAYIHFAESLGIGGSVDFMGKQNQLNRFYQEATLFVLPSRREGMSNALMEAMLYGLPCVVTNISGNQDLIENGKTGLLVPPKDIDGLVNGICFMLSHPKEAIQMGEQAREKIISEFSMSFIGEQYVSLYEGLLNPQSP